MVQTTNAILMCFNTSRPKPPEVKPPAPPPPTPAPPPAPKPLPETTPLDAESEKTKPNVQYGRKKSADTRARKGTDSLRIPLSNPSEGGNTGGLNV
jgi:hypothetical protein